MLRNQEKQEKINKKLEEIKEESEKLKPKGHLTLIEREKITVMYSQKCSVREISRALRRSPSTISRELRRKEVVRYRGQYLGIQTHQKVKENWNKTHNRPKINNPKIREYIIKGLEKGLTPELIAGRLRIKYDFKIYHETIYKFIYSTNNELHLTEYLLRRKFGRVPRDIRKHNKRKYTGIGKNIPNRVDIDLRPQEANLRLEFGHFEADSIEGTRKRITQTAEKNRQKRKSCLTVLTDRASRVVKVLKTASLTSIQTTTSILKAMKPYRNTIKSITYDNGKEFSKHEIINKELNIQSYFCKPYHSWEKGTVENINGLIRRFFPKGTDFDMITDEQIKRVEDWINNRPMKVLGYLTPNEKYRELMKFSKFCV